MTDATAASAFESGAGMTTGSPAGPAEGHFEGHSEGHGNTPAAWTAVVIVMIAFTIGTLGIVLGNWIIFWVGAALVVVGGIAGKVMASMGLGQRPRKQPA